MGFWDFFGNRYKLPVHIVQLVLIIAAMGLSVPRLFMKNQPRTRANTIALGMGAKSLMFLAYQLLSEHTRMFKKWKSYKAYAILNGLECVFWGAVIFLVMQANLKRCVGIGCKLSWGVVAIGVILNQMYVYMFLVTYNEFRMYKKGMDFEKTRSTDSQQMHLPTYVAPTHPKPSHTQHSEIGRMESGHSSYSYPQPPQQYSSRSYSESSRRPSYYEGHTYTSERPSHSRTHSHSRSQHSHSHYGGHSHSHGNSWSGGYWVRPTRDSRSGRPSNSSTHRHSRRDSSYTRTHGHSRRHSHSRRDSRSRRH